MKYLNLKNTVVGQTTKSRGFEKRSRQRNRTIKKFSLSSLSLIYLQYALVTLGPGLQASEYVVKDVKHNVDCPCSFDEPFVGVLQQIRQNRSEWSFGSNTLNAVQQEGGWRSYHLYKNEQKHSTFQQKLLVNQSSSNLSCSWVQWSENGSIKNKIGMGHYLYKGWIQGKRAKNACREQITGLIPFVAPETRLDIAKSDRQLFQR